MEIVTGETKRGFNFIEFRDRYGAACMIEESSLATEDAIWFGTIGDRMHLTQEQVLELLPTLQHFAATGKFEYVKKD